jgi:hypothetical protein
VFSFERNLFFNKYVNTLRVREPKESGRLTKTRSYKRHEDLEDYEEARNQGTQDTCKSQGVRKSQRRLPDLKNPETQESGRLA